MAKEKKADEKVETQDAAPAGDATVDVIAQHDEQAAAQLQVNGDSGAAPDAAAASDTAAPDAATTASEPAPAPQANRQTRGPATTVNRNGTVTVARLEKSWVGRPQEEIAATDPARALAQEHGVDLNEVTPTGANGDILVTDVEQFLGIAEPKAQE